MAQVASKLDYLGRGVDCREPEETWLDNLDHYTTKKIRDFSEGDGSITENPVTKKKTESRNETTESKIKVEGSVKATPHRGINLRGELKVKRDISKMPKYKINSYSTRIVILKEDTSQDLYIIKREGTDPPIHYTKYEKELSQFILDDIDTMQTEASAKGGEEATATATCLGKMIKDLKEGDSVARLEEYLQLARSQKELYQQIWQALADACCSFINKKPYMYTHYVKSVRLGAIQEESEESMDSNRDTSPGTHVTGFDAVDGSLEGGHQAIDRGTIGSDSGTEIAEEVIEASLEPVSSLINKKSRELKIVMEWLLKCYSCADQGALQGPFLVSCRKRPSLGREHEIYWQVIGDEICGTIMVSEASTFYIQCTEEQYCCIIHKTSVLQTQYFVTVRRPFDTECPLKLVPYPEHERDIYFTLMSKTKQPVSVPQTEDKWKRGSPFFIKLPAGGAPIIGRLYKPVRYVNVRRIIEEGSKKKTKSSDADSKGEVPKHTPASGATLNYSDHEMKQEIESCVSDAKDIEVESKRTIVTGMTSDTPPAPKSEEILSKETREMQNRESIIEKLKYTTSSSATLETADKNVMQFYFTPIENIQGSRVTFSTPPPSSISPLPVDIPDTQQ